MDGGPLLIRAHTLGLLAISLARCAQHTLQQPPPPGAGGGGVRDADPSACMATVYNGCDAPLSILVPMPVMKVAPLTYSVRFGEGREERACGARRGAGKARRTHGRRVQLGIVRSALHHARVLQVRGKRHAKVRALIGRHKQRAVLHLVNDNALATRLEAGALTRRNLVDLYC